MIKALTVATAIAVTTPAFAQSQLLPHPAGCPRIAFCGCGVSVRIWGHAKREFYRAAAYFRFPRAAAAPGMVAVRKHHVMYIESINPDGTATVYDPNGGGHRTWRHERSLAGYSIRDPNG